MIAIAVLPVGAAIAQQPLLQPGDRLAIVGGTLAERMQEHGHFEAELHTRRPGWNLSVRNLGWSGDTVTGIARKRFDKRAEGYAKLMRGIELADPTVVLVMYGFAEASDGEAGVQKFSQQLKKLTSDLSAQDVRVVLLQPFAFPGVRTSGYDEAMSRCAHAVRGVAEQTSAEMIDVDWRPSPAELNQSRLLPNETGFQELATKLADQMVGQQSAPGPSEELLQAIARKNELFFHRYRPQNETYLFLFRKHEQGNNAVEVEQFDPLIAEADRKIWRIASAAKN